METVSETGVTMRLILVRHADARPVGSRGVANDFDRPLSEKGQMQARQLGVALRAHHLTPDAVMCSPLVRTTQTARELSSEWREAAPTPVSCPHLSTEEFDADELVLFVNGFHVETVALVGHSPDIGEFAARLIGAGIGSLPFAKAGMAMISFDREVREGEGTLEWFLPPEWLTPLPAGASADRV